MGPHVFTEDSRLFGFIYLHRKGIVFRLALDATGRHQTCDSRAGWLQPIFPKAL